MTIFSCEPGTYFIGDLCYVMSDKWNEVCNKIIQGNTVLDGWFQLDDGTSFGIFSTAYGDGMYTSDDALEASFPVDSGSIGIISTKYIDLPKFSPFVPAIIDFPAPFQCSMEESGIMQFGHIRIDTTSENYDEEYWVDSDEYME